MRHVIPLAVLRKSNWAHGRGHVAQARAHKYIRREPTGKFTRTGGMIWRYFFRDDHARIAGQQHDPEGEHRHIDEHTNLHPAHRILTRAAQIIEHDIEKDGNRADYTKVSRHPGDKFYEFHHAGRVIRARIGPTDEQAQEGGWSWKPGVDKLGRGNLKELYDENGRALNSTQAGLWLRQDAWEKKATAKPDEVPDRLAVRGAYSEKFNSAPIEFVYNYSTLREIERNKLNPTSHMGVPHEVSEQEFGLHSGSFAYGQFKKVKAVGNTLTFDNENPDGSTTRVLVHEQTGQLLDPLVQRLVNPRNQVVRNARDLADLFRQAAKERTTAWVTIDATKSGSLERHYLHAQLQFDGAGQPRILGGYWAKKLGKKAPRLDDLLNRYGKIEAERIRRTSSKQIPLVQGNDAEYFDPARKVWLRGTFIATNPKTAEHGRSYTVQSKSGQQFEASFIRRVYDERRDLMALRSDLLLHFVAGDRGGYKFLLPTDGSVKLEDLKAVPHVTVDEEAGTATLDDPSYLDEVRTAIGGFSIDEAAMEQLDSKLAALEEAERRRRRGDDVLPKSLIQPKLDASGNPVPGEYDFSHVPGWNKNAWPREHQIAFLKRFVAAGGRMLAAHHVGTGKSSTAIATALLLRQLGKLRDDGDPTKPHALAAMAPKKVLIVVPTNVLKGWQAETRKFDTGSLIVANPANAKGAFTIARAKAALAAGEDNYYLHVTNPEYLREHREEFEKLGYDFLIVDEAHRTTGKAAGGKRSEINETLRGLNAKVKGMIMLTGTPVTNNLRTLPEYVDLLSNGTVKLGQFEQEYLMPDPITKGKFTHVRPEKAGELAAILGGLMDVVTTRDVKGAVMPLSRMDDTIPAYIKGLQADIIRMYTAGLSAESKAKMADLQSLDLDERTFLSADEQTAVNKARGVLLSVGFKPASEDRNLRYAHPEFDKDPKTGKSKVVDKSVDAHYPAVDLARWPKVWTPPQLEGQKAVPGRGEIHDGLSAIWDLHIAKELGVETYADLAGTATTAAQRKRLAEWGGKPIENPDFGPEGVISRGESVNDESGRFVGVRDIESHGVKVRIGEKWYGDSDFRFYREADFARETQKPREGARDVLTHPEMRDERRKFDLSLTTGNAYTDHLEEHINSVLHPEVGDPDAQMVHFAHNITSGMRTLEGKLRTMGYVDANEAMESLRANSNAALPPKFFVSYGAPENTLGNRDLNSTMFQKLKVERWPPMAFVDDEEVAKYDRAARKLGHANYASMAGGLLDFQTQAKLERNQDLADSLPARLRDVDSPTSEFVARTDMHRQVVEAESSGQPQPTAWTAGDRKSIRSEFGIGVPLFVRSRDGKTEYHYGGAGIDAAVDDYQNFDQKTPEYAHAKAKIDKALQKGWSATPPLTDKQRYVFNNVQHMVATDAANVGLNWGNAVNLTLFDTPFTPAAEQQRIGRAARALAAPKNRKILALLNKVDTLRASAERDLRDAANQHEIATGFAKHVLDSDVMTEVSARLTKDERRTLRELKYMVDVKRMVAHMDVQDPKTGEVRTEPLAAQARVIQFARGKAAGIEDLIRMIQSGADVPVRSRYVHASDATLRSSFARVSAKRDAQKSIFVVPESLLRKGPSARMSAPPHPVIPIWR